MPQPAATITAATPSCPAMAPAEVAAISAEKTGSSFPAESECQQGCSSRRRRSSQDCLPAEYADSSSPSVERRKLLKDSCGAARVAPVPSESCPEGSTTSRTLGTEQRDILRMAFNRGGLKFGSFTLKSGRQSPFFFNSGCFSDGEAMELLAKAYAKEIVQSGIHFDVLFGPAYKGIPLVACTAMALSTKYGLSAPFVYDRKEPKDHGEGGRLVGAVEAFDRKPLVDGAGDSSSAPSSDAPCSSAPSSASAGGSSSAPSSSSSSGNNKTGDSSCSSSSTPTTRPARVILLDDVLTAGSAARASLAVLRAQFPDIQVAALCLLLDRQERSNLDENLSASQTLEAELKTKVLSVLHMADILKFLEELVAAAEGEERSRLEEARRRLVLYLERFGRFPVKEPQPTAEL